MREILHVSDQEEWLGRYWMEAVAKSKSPIEAYNSIEKEISDRIDLPVVDIDELPNKDWLRS